MREKPVQDFYPDDLSYCYGCGKLNENGHRIKSYWNHGNTISHFTPKPYHTAIPGFVYGGLIASLIDCHGTGTAALVSYRAEEREPGSMPPLRFVTASLQVDFLLPTPLGCELELIGTAIEIKGRKVVSEIEVFTNGVLTAKGKVVAVQMPETMITQNAE